MQGERPVGRQLIHFPEPEPEPEPEPAQEQKQDLKEHEQEQQGYGIIIITNMLMHTLHIPQLAIDYTDTQGAIRDHGVFQQLHEALCLPDVYQIEAIYFQYFRFFWVILLRSPLFPIREQEITPPKYGIVYRIDMSGKNNPPVFLRMEPLSPTHPFADLTEYSW